jgi:hypothetical protein
VLLHFRNTSTAQTVRPDGYLDQTYPDDICARNYPPRGSFGTEG